LDIGTDQALQVEVTLDGDKAQLDFRTNDASARVALQNNAEQVLNDLLARSGLGLAGFSVGSQAHQSAQQNPHPSHSAPKGHANQFVKTSEAESLTVQRWTPRSTSSVDIYA
jgi:flagellar hook-length control protein FliK